MVIGTNCNISIHALLAESDHSAPDGGRTRDTISIHALLAESDTVFFLWAWMGGLFLSTLSLRRATHYDNYNLHCVEISIHALLAESDSPLGRTISFSAYFYPRSPCGERRCKKMELNRTTSNFYPRSPCGERHLRVVDGSKSSIISIHALLAESDPTAKKRSTWIKDFYPRSPCGERRAASITPTASRNFYPRSPCGERPRTQSQSLSA